MAKRTDPPTDPVQPVTIRVQLTRTRTIDGRIVQPGLYEFPEDIAHALIATGAAHRAPTS